MTAHRWFVAIVLACAASVGVPPPAPGPRIFIAGDSTAAYASPSHPRAGWGQAISCFLDPQVNVENRAKGARSTRTYMAQGWLDGLEQSLRPGDTLLIQFGHNDAYRAVRWLYTPIPDFQANLARMIKVAHRQGAQPVLISPVSLREFQADGSPANRLAGYAQAVRETATATATPLIDLNADSQALLHNLGPEASKPLYVSEEGDVVHLSPEGAARVAELVAHRLAALGLPASAHVRPRRADCQSKRSPR